MKYSGIEWIGNIPDNWKLERLQWHLDEIKESNDPIQTKQVLSLTNKLGVIPYEEKGEQGNKSKENFAEYKLAYPNTIVANSMNILIGSVGKCDYFGCVSPVYYVFKPKENNDIDFLNYLFQTTEFQKELRKYANGILEIRLRVSSSDILKREIPLPSFLIQQQIVSYLNRKCSEIDLLIENENKQIEKLKEYKQAIITNAVTKGINKNVEYKDSGIESIGFIPCHWNLLRTKFVCDSFEKGTGITRDEVFENGDIECVRYGEIYTTYEYAFNECKSKTFENEINPKVYFEKGDILFSGTGELVEEIGKNIVYLGNNKCLAGGDIIIAKHHQDPYYLNYALASESSQIQKSKGKAKLKVVHISASNIGNIYITIPPIQEQVEIGKYLNEKIEAINKIITIKNNKIEKLQEYKKSLIYEYVTGKKELIL